MLIIRCDRCQREVDIDEELFPTWTIAGSTVCDACLRPSDYRLTGRMAAALALGDKPNGYCNHELEDALDSVFGGAWAIAEPCEYNGDACRYGELTEERVRRFWEPMLKEPMLKAMAERRARLSRK